MKEFKCTLCDFETDDEDEIIYCCQCSRPMCENCVKAIEHQGFQELICIDCNAAYAMTF